MNGARVGENRLVMVTYFARRHVSHGSVRLHALQLIQTPVQLLQGLHRQFDDMALIWIDKKRKVEVCSCNQHNEIFLNGLID